MAIGSTPAGITRMFFESPVSLTEKNIISQNFNMVRYYKLTGALYFEFTTGSCYSKLIALWYVLL